MPPGEVFSGEQASGYFDWEALEVSSLPSLVGRRARELFDGHVDQGRFTLRGNRIDDPIAGQRRIVERGVERVHVQVSMVVRPFMSVDSYRIAVSRDRVTGRSRTHEGDWSGTLEGERVGCDVGSPPAEP